MDKTYEVLIDLSRISDTRDRDAREMIESVTIDPSAVPGIIDRIPGLLGSLVPEANLPVPSFSAKKKDGKKLYDLARKGIMTQEMRIMRIHEVSQISISFPLVSCRISVGSGTYIRSIAYRLGQQLGTGGIVQELRRVSVGPYSLDEIVLDQEVEGVRYVQLEG
jgi:tRNA pseudouridine55 synthase